MPDAGSPPRVIRFPRVDPSRLEGRSAPAPQRRLPRAPSAGADGRGLVDRLSRAVILGAVPLLVFVVFVGADRAVASVVLLALAGALLVRGLRFLVWLGRGASPTRPRWMTRPRVALAFLVAAAVLMSLSDQAMRDAGGLLLNGAVAGFAGALVRRAVARRPAGPRPVLGAAAQGRGWAMPASADRRAAVEAGISGEETVVQALTGGLPGGPEGYVVLQNLRLPGRSEDVDHLVVGPTGLFVLETKNLDGVIWQDSLGRWHRDRTGRRGGVYEAQIGDPEAQVGRNVRALRHFLEAQAPELCARVRLWITGLIVFPKREATLMVSGGRFAALHLEDLVPAILGTRPQRPLTPEVVARLVDLLVAANERPAAANGTVPAGAVRGWTGPGSGFIPGHERGNAILETALVVPLLLTLAFGVVGVGRVVQAKTGVNAVAREASRTAALTASTVAGSDRGQEVGVGYGLGNGSLQVSVSGAFGRGDLVRADVVYRVDLSDLPLLGWVRIWLTGTHAERVDLYSSRAS